MHSIQRILTTCFGVMAVGFWSAPMALAQAWPERTVRVIIPFPPGGTLDKVGRMLAQRLGEQFGQTFVVENRPGGNGVIGGDAVAKAAPDGHTLLFNASTFVTAPLTMKSVPYRVQTDFVPISLVAQAPLSMAISNKVGAADLRALVAAAKADGHIDARERELIEGEFTKLDNDQELQHWLHAELNKPLDPADVARAASTPEMAAEMYIASVMLVDEESFMEKSYLDELARQLKLEPGLKVELEKQVRQAAV